MLLRIMAIVALSLLAAFPLSCRDADPLDHRLHPRSKIAKERPSSPFADTGQKPISPREAARHALGHLKRHGVAEPVICEVQWIAAPVSGYLVDSLGRASSKDGTFTTFRIGILDGSEEQAGRRKAGEEFVFIARGLDSSGRVLWLPSPGPDDRLTQGGSSDAGLAYEFLLEREKFEALAERYP